MLDDGKIRLRVTDFGPDFAETVVVAGGALSNRKGVNVPDAVLPLSAMTDKDRADLDYGLKLGITGWQCCSCSGPKTSSKSRPFTGRAGIVAKLEKLAAITHLEAIVAEADASWSRAATGCGNVAEQVPSIQRQIVQLAAAPASPSSWQPRCSNP